MAYATTRWRKMNFLVMHAMVSLREAGTTDVSDAVMLERLRALIVSGRLEVVGDPLNNHYCEVRLPTAAIDE